MPQQYSLYRSENKKDELIEKTLEVSLGGGTFYLDVPRNPMVYVSETKGIIYINGSSYWDSIMYMFRDIKGEFTRYITVLAQSLGKTPISTRDELLEVDENKGVEKRKYSINVYDIEVGFYYNVYLPQGTRNGFIEIIPFFMQKSKH
ncbi:hypothetical protein GWK48_07195 [Metallosphaera tengchongensis]|uniref:Uncharacterized protein n=1 Tax=Metallosphaera tengchongensis TaxID=1532350 RepID=A0A6N0NVF4_9CREN|nr:hypothetical protein [Metallosphaera tengchongensis]QKR00187.1 hypothetical protein GWK48_07195 [Metallosphaera tengchongensis]